MCPPPEPSRLFFAPLARWETAHRDKAETALRPRCGRSSRTETALCSRCGRNSRNNGCAASAPWVEVEVGSGRRRVCSTLIFSPHCLEPHDLLPQSLPGQPDSPALESVRLFPAPRLPLPWPWPWPWRASSYESPSFDALPRRSGGPPQRRAIAIHRMAPIEKPRLIKLPRNYLPFGKMYCQLFTAYTGLDDIMLPLARKAQLRD